MKQHSFFASASLTALSYILLVLISTACLGNDDHFMPRYRVTLEEELAADANFKEYLATAIRLYRPMFTALSNYENEKQAKSFYMELQRYGTTSASQETRALILSKLGYHSPEVFYSVATSLYKQRQDLYRKHSMLKVMKVEEVEWLFNKIASKPDYRTFITKLFAPENDLLKDRELRRARTEDCRCASQFFTCGNFRTVLAFMANSQQINSDQDITATTLPMMIRWGLQTEQCTLLYMSCVNSCQQK